MSVGHNVQRAYAFSVQDAEVPKKSLRGSIGSDVEIRHRFRIARERLGLTGTEMARRGGVQQSSISRFETADRGMSTANVLRVLQVAAELGVNLHYVINGDGSPLRASLPSNGAPIVAADTPELEAKLAELLEILHRGDIPKAPKGEGSAPAKKRNKR